MLQGGGVVTLGFQQRVVPLQFLDPGEAFALSKLQQPVFLRTQVKFLLAALDQLDEVAMGGFSLKRPLSRSVANRARAWRIAPGVLQIPASALFRFDGKWALFVMKDNKAKRRAVKVGQRNGLSAQILAGLAGAIM
jgi:hypothetical protein